MRNVVRNLDVVALTMAALLAPLGPSALADDSPPRYDGMVTSTSQIRVSGARLGEVHVTVWYRDPDGLRGHQDPCSDLYPNALPGSRVELTGPEGRSVLLPFPDAPPAPDGGQVHTTWAARAADAGTWHVARVVLMDGNGAQTVVNDPGPAVTVVGRDAPVLQLASPTGGLQPYAGIQRFTGRVVGGNSGQPLVGVPVRTYGLGVEPETCNPGSFARPMRQLTTDGQGRFTTSYGNVTTPNWAVGVEAVGDVHGQLLLRRVPLRLTSPAQHALAISAAPERATAPAGTQVLVRGAVMPNRATEYLRLQRWVSGVWKTVAGAALRESSRFTVVAQPPGPGRHAYRVYKPSTPGSRPVVTKAFVITATSPTTT